MVNEILLMELKIFPLNAFRLITLQVLLGEIDEEKESKSSLKEVSLEEILEAQSKHQAEKTMNEMNELGSYLK